jgi:hypothetical protein
MFQRQLQKFSNKMRPSRDSFGCSHRVGFFDQSSNDFFQMKLNAVNQLVVGAFDHHLIFAEIRSCEQLEAAWNAFDLQTVILPDS